MLLLLTLLLLLLLSVHTFLPLHAVLRAIADLNLS